MLQPFQLRDVLARFAGEIAELHTFLERSGIAVDAPGSLAELLRRVHDDRGFHRDLTSYLWVALEGSGHGITTADLLGVLAVAAAGPVHASAADEALAHDLLRLVMETRRTIDGTPNAAALAAHMPLAAEPDAAATGMPSATMLQERQRTARSVQGAAPAEVAAVSQDAALIQNAASSQGTVAIEDAAADEYPAAVEDARAGTNTAAFEDPAAWTRNSTAATRVESSSDEEGTGTGRRVVWFAVAASVLALLGTVVWLLLRPSAATAVGPTATVVVRPAQTAQPAPPTTQGETAQDVARGTAPRITASAAEAPPVLRMHQPARAQAAGARSSADRSLPHTAREPQMAASAPVERTPSHATAATPLTTPLAAPFPAASTSPAAGVVLPHAAAPTARGFVPAGVLSQRLGSRGVPVYASSPEVDSSVTTVHVPRLLRRVPASAAPPLQEEVAEVRPGDAPSVRAQTSAATAGTVRPEALGIMAGNLLYSPAPVYPAAASAARVQGEVRVQAEVDRDGNVSYARVVSGPPLLRDAAVAAVQHWRYKPYLAHGKAVPMTAMAVVEFELN